MAGASAIDAHGGRATPLGLKRDMAAQFPADQRIGEYLAAQVFHPLILP